MRAKKYFKKIGYVVVFLHATGQFCVQNVFAEDNENSLFSYVSLWSGAKVENPYSISVNPDTHVGTLNSTDTKTDGYIELRLNYRFVDRIASAGADTPKEVVVFGSDTGTRQPIKPGFLWHWGHYPVPDITTSIGYVFRNSSAPTNFNTATIAGGSDIYVMGGLGFPYWRYWSDDTLLKAIQATLEISGGFVTDKENLILHPTIFVGGGFQFLYFRGNDEKNPWPGYWTGRIGLASVDQPKLISDSTVAVNGRDEPKFSSSWVPSIGFDITFPFSRTLSAQFGGNAYFTKDPASWNITVGLVIDVDGLFKALLK